jgi:hypothetical protein
MSDNPRKWQTCEPACADTQAKEGQSPASQCSIVIKQNEVDHHGHQHKHPIRSLIVTVIVTIITTTATVITIAPPLLHAPPHTVTPSPRGGKQVEHPPLCRATCRAH